MYWDILSLLSGLVGLVVLGLIIGLPIYFLTRKKDTTKPTTPSSHLFLGFALFVLTIVFAQQIINLLFPAADSTRVIAKLIIDAALIAIGLGLRRKIVGSAILYAGIVRFVLIFLQLRGMDPTVRVIVIFITLIALLVVGYLKFGKSFSSKNKLPKEEV